ncbi:MAG: spermidine/putrescine ABC transporter permease PotC [Campylobacterales bacterium]|nr:spermidine/putrescine ABC transporter permease PotC [Campylobacterales bacterium]
MKFFERLYLGMIYLFLYVPIFVLIVYSFNASRYAMGWSGFSLEWYERLFKNTSLLDAALNSVSIAFFSATVATLLGTIGAVAIFRYHFAGKQFLKSMVYVLILSPEIVMGIALLILFVLVGVKLGFVSLLIAHITFCLPFVVVTVLSRLAGFDRSVIEAAKDLGASGFYTFSHIILPSILPAVIAGFLLSFTLSLDDVIISFFVSGVEFEILPIKIYSMVRLGVKPEINALCTIMFAVTIVLVFVSQLLLKERK